MVSCAEDGGVLLERLSVSVLEQAASLTKGDCGSNIPEQLFGIPPLQESGEEVLCYLQECFLVRGTSQCPQQLPLDNGWEGVSRVTGAVVQELLWVGWLHKKFAVQHSSAPKSSAFIQLEVQEGGAVLGAAAGEFDGGHLAV